MRISLRTLFLFIAAVSISLALTQLDFLTSCLILVEIVVSSGFFVTKRVWRYGVYGAILGIIGGQILMRGYMLFDQGRFLASTYQESDALGDIAYAWRSYVIHLGALAGATLGLVLCRNAGHEESSPQL